MDSPGTNKELEALVDLIDEPDELIYRKIRDRIITYGKLAVPYLEKAWENNLQPLAQKRIEVLLHKIQFKNVCEELNNWYSLGGSNLLMGYLLVSKYQYPSLDEKKIRNELERLKQDIWLELNPGLTAFEKIRVVNRIIFNENKFEVNKAEINSPLNYFINNVLESHKGNVLSLAMVYLIIVNSVDLPVFGVDLPEQFVLAYMDEHSRMPGMPITEAEVLFYLDVFTKGTFFNHDAIELFLRQRNIESKYSFYRPCSNITIIRRLLQELYDSFKQAGNNVKTGEVEIMLSIFK